MLEETVGEEWWRRCCRGVLEKSFVEECGGESGEVMSRSVVL